MIELSHIQVYLKLLLFIHLTFFLIMSHDMGGFLLTDTVPYTEAPYWIYADWRHNAASETKLLHI